MGSKRDWKCVWHGAAIYLIACGWLWSTAPCFRHPLLLLLLLLLLLVVCAYGHFHFTKNVFSVHTNNRRRESGDSLSKTSCILFWLSSEKEKIADETEKSRNILKVTYTKTIWRKKAIEWEKRKRRRIRDHNSGRFHISNESREIFCTIYRETSWWSKMWNTDDIV